MKVKCIEKPNEGYVKREVTKDKVYEVISKDDNDYKLIDDNGEEWYNQISHFIELPDEP